MHADLHGAGVVLGAVEDVDLALADDGGGVEGVERLPVNWGMGDWIGKGGEFVGGDYGGGDRPAEGAERRWLLCPVGEGGSEREEDSELRGSGERHHCFLISPNFMAELLSAAEGYQRRGRSMPMEAGAVGRKPNCA